MATDREFRRLDRERQRLFDENINLRTMLNQCISDLRRALEQSWHKNDQLRRQLQESKQSNALLARDLERLAHKLFPYKFSDTEGEIKDASEIVGLLEFYADSDNATTESE